MKNNTLKIVYLIFDLLSSAFAWALFFFYRKTYIENSVFRPNDNFYYGLITIPLIWICLFYLSGAYKNVRKRHRIKEFGHTFLVSLIASLLFFFVLLLDDEVNTYNDYYKLLLTLFGLLFGFSLITRYSITSYIVKQVHKGKISFPTLIVGGNIKALEIYKEVTNLKQSAGNKFIGYISVNGIDKKLETENLPNLGPIENIEEVIQSENIEEVIIAIESSEHEYLRGILNQLAGYELEIKIIPDMYDILSGSVKMTNIFGLPLIKIDAEILPSWQKSIKAFIDFFISFICLIILSPFLLVIGVIVKLTSKGEIFFKQERIGINGKPFQIYKFRTMYTDAEKNGPQLSSQNDNRITPFGRFLRKTRIDEFPQFYNVLKGDMSLVGPRPERQFYIDQIMERAPHYKHIQKIKPGITSWGQVKYGYAENIEEMIQRLKFDVLYLENMSLALDFKIMVYTILTMLKGSGK